MAAAEIVNATDKRLAFKFKVNTSNNIAYRVSTVYGIIEPRGRVELDIHRQTAGREQQQPAGELDTVEFTVEVKVSDNPQAQEEQSPPPPMFDDDDFNLENALQATAAVSGYLEDIFNYHKSRERLFRVDDYISSNDRQTHVTHRARAQLVNWLVEMHETFELNPETLHLAVKLFDMFMDRLRWRVQSEELQLMAAVACWIAAKFDEIPVPQIEEFVFAATDQNNDAAFTEEQMEPMERDMLRTLDFNLGSPLSCCFLNRFAEVSNTDMTTLALAHYTLEMSLMSLHLVSRKSESLMAAASLLLAMRMKERADYGEEGSADAEFLDAVQQSSGYTIAQLEPLMWELNRMLIQREERFAGLDNVFRKYSHEDFFEVSKIPPLQQTGEEEEEQKLSIREE